MMRSRAWWAAALFAAVVAAGTVCAQDIVIDGERITADDIDQRSKFDQFATHRTPSRQEVLDELRAEARKTDEARSLGLDVSDTMVDEVLATWAKRMNLTRVQLLRAFANAGIPLAAVRHHTRADIADRWIKRRSLPYALFGTE
jgi:hypothetical protein